MNTLVLTMVALTAQSAFAVSDCTAPSSVRGLAQLIEQTFDGSTVNCDDDSSFSTEFAFICKGSDYHAVKDPSDITRRADGTEVYVITVLSEVEGALKMTELVYPDAASYYFGTEPLEVLETAFLSLSSNAFSFYANKPVTSDSWISSTWYVVDGEKARGYKLYADRAVSCQAE